MALDPFRRIRGRRQRFETSDPAKGSRIPYVISAIGLIALLGLVYQLGVSGFSGKTAQLSAWFVQPPP